jgi:hypothetical protein
MKLLIGWITAATVLASPCAWDTSQRELLDRLKKSPAQAAALPYPLVTSQSISQHKEQA